MNQRSGGTAQTGLQQADALRRPVRGEGVADDPVARDRAPEAAVVGRATVVTHHEVVLGRDRYGRWKVAALAAAAGRGEGLLLALAVEDDMAVLDGDGVAGTGDDPLDEVDVGLLGRRRGAGL